jgi:hypothetical protein
VSRSRFEPGTYVQKSEVLNLVTACSLTTIRSVTYVKESFLVRKQSLEDGSLSAKGILSRVHRTHILTTIQHKKIILSALLPLIRVSFAEL